MTTSVARNSRISRQEKLSIWLLVAAVLAGAVGSAFAAGFVIGRMLL
ncbi:MAG TPA: hypothetical protein VE984_10755 [Gaiellaceae bacterium]|nr:hypothetical protein [Gaiellaceae bacterium]